MPRPLLNRRQFDAIPDELKARPQWIVWQGVPGGNGKLDKIPYSVVTGWKASSTDPATWATFEQAVAAWLTGNWSGIGYMFSLDDPYVGADLDDCHDPETGTLDPWADEIVEMLDSYTEVSPSGRGVKTIIRAELPDDPNRSGYGRRSPRLEVYSGERFFTLTGRSLWWTPTTIQERTAPLAAIYTDAFMTPETAAPAEFPRGELLGQGISDDELLTRARRAANGDRFAQLWEGNTSYYDDDDSRADQALCSMLAFWTGPDPARIDRLFRQSGLYRPKWERADYRDATINRALNRTEFWSRSSGSTRRLRGLERGDASDHDESRDYHWSDYGNAERFADRYGQDVRYVDLWGKWLVWDGRRWQMDETQSIVRLAKATVRSIYAEANALDDSDQRKALTKFALASESANRIRALLDLAKSDATIAATPDEFDTDPWTLTVQNGVVDLRTGALMPHHRGYGSTKIIPVNYDPDATCPAFLAFLDTIFAGKPDLIQFIQRALGYCLTGSTREQVIFLCHGTGSNGKSTFLNVALDLLNDYAMQTPTETFMVKRGESIPNDIARLRGARLVTAVETEDGRRLSESLIKQLTGGDKIAARFMRAEWFDFRPTFKIWLATNHKPVIRGTDQAIWRRIRLIPFTVTIAPGQQDKQLPERLKAELPGILRWVVQGCLDWQMHGLGVPQEVEDATANYRMEMDVLATWIADCCVVDIAVRAAAKDLYRSYTEWCEQTGERSLAQRTFGMRLTERGFDNHRGTGGNRQWIGIGLKAGSQ